MIGRRTLIRIAALAGASPAFAAPIVLPSSARPHLAPSPVVRDTDAGVIFKIDGWESCDDGVTGNPPPRLSRPRRSVDQRRSVMARGVAMRSPCCLELTIGGHSRAMTTTINLTVNGEAHVLEADDPDMPLLYALRDQLGLHGLHYGCGLAQCGACTVHYYGEALRSCVMPVSAVADAEIVTLEGLGTPKSRIRCSRHSSTNRPPSAATASMA